MSRSMSGQRVVLTGAAGGVGRATLRALAAEGCRVCATDLSASVNSLAEEMGLSGLVTIAADVSRSDDVERIYELAERTFGDVDCLISNAARIVSKPVHETTEEEWDGVMDVNVKSFFLMARRVLPSMIRNRAGAIVATGSISSVVGLQAQAAYCASKGALLQLVRQMAVDYASSGIRVNAVGPGSIDTPFLRTYLEGLDDPDAGAAAIKAAHPLGRWAQPEEIADAILYLAGPTSSFVTGQILMVDGGYTAR